ncbi:hypothetical protein HaLaN_22622 [Haematococcus lacustris]|uniref:Uncharacterized protein n=1 Tax=Haematococcus lacustris TaxID=44745 RepID=A0A6A0A163_HAELA|nr:hypothetical protein HaLaN_22622 [Haematococcus lacustris]
MDAAVPQGCIHCQAIITAGPDLSGHHQAAGAARPAVAGQAGRGAAHGCGAGGRPRIRLYVIHVDLSCIVKREKGSKRGKKVRLARPTKLVQQGTTCWAVGNLTQLLQTSCSILGRTFDDYQPHTGGTRSWG